MQTKTRSDKVACTVFRSPFIYFISRHRKFLDLHVDMMLLSTTSKFLCMQQSHEIEVVKSKEELKTANDSID